LEGWGESGDKEELLRFESHIGNVRSDCDKNFNTHIIHTEVLH